MKKHTHSASVLEKTKGASFILYNKINQGSRRPSFQSWLLPDTNFPGRGHWVASPLFFLNWTQ